LHLIVAPQLSVGWQHNYSTKARQADHVYEQSVYSLMSMPHHLHGNQLAFVQKQYTAWATHPFSKYNWGAHSATQYKIINPQVQSISQGTLTEGESSVQWTS
jgi:hypothetical protein